MKKYITLAVFLATTPIATSAQENCGPRDQVVQFLSEKYGETRQAIGLGSNNAVLEVFANLEGGSWSITVTRTDGVTCLIASGEGYENIVETLPPKGDPA